MRAIWSGEISFGLVAVPVKLYPATRDLSPRFHYLHETCGTRIVTVRRCPYHEVDVPWNEIVKGYEVSKGRYAEFTPAELSELEAKEGAQGIDLVQFVDQSEIELSAIANSYWVGPAGKTMRAYVLLREALEKTKRAGIARVKIRTRTRLALLRPRERRFSLDMLRYPDELVAAADVELPESTKRIPPSEVELAVDLVKRMTAHFDVSKHGDEYRRLVQEAVESKVERGEVAEERAQAVEARGGKLVDLADLLSRSLKTQGAAKKRAPAAAARTGRKPRGKRSAARRG